ncbi:MAG: PD-(D/E)XK nuclease family transposase [Thomasclavelia sp.]
MDQNKIKKAHLTIPFHNDLFFKYMLVNNQTLLERILKIVTGITFTIVSILNPAINSDTVNGKGIVLDLLVEDEEKNKIDIEMQMYGSKFNEYIRFHFYGCRLIANQLVVGENYYGLKKAYQVIFINQRNPDHLLYDKFIFKGRTNREDEGNLNYRYYVYLSEIDDILKKKKKEELSELERLCYLFKNNEYDGIIKEEKDDLIKQVVEMYEKFTEDKMMWDLAFVRESARMREEGMMAESYDNGKRAMQESMLQKQIMIKYGQDESKWLESLTEKQLEKITEEILKEITLDELKSKVEK